MLEIKGASVLRHEEIYGVHGAGVHKRFHRVDYMTWFFWLLACWVIWMLIGIVFEIFICGVVYAFQASGALQSKHGKRSLIRFLRMIPFGKSWRRKAKPRRVFIEQPFAINLLEVDPICFVGMNRTEVTAILKVPIDQENPERSTSQVIWNREDFHVECWFEGDVCRYCFFYSKDAQGVLRKISGTPH